MQNIVVMAFRKRLKNLGYKNISIRRDKDGEYSITAAEPLAGFIVSCKFPLTELYHKAR